MILLDTDMMSLFAAGHPVVVARVRTATESVATTLITRIEILQGRFDFLCIPRREASVGQGRWG